MKRLLLLCLMLGTICLSLTGVPQASAIPGGLVVYCIPYCCNPAIPDTQKCRYNNADYTCGWFRVPGRSACL